MALSRRQFLVTGSTVAVATLGWPLAVSRSAFGANEEIRLAVVGCGIRGNVHIQQFGRQQGVRIVAVCDPDRERLVAAAKTVEARFGYKPETFVDVRRLMERKDFDVAAVATMQYWHSLPVIWACETGRQVYVEKPLAHFIWEGRQMVNAARKYNRLVQVGLQSRSSETDRQAEEYIRSGQLGKIRYIVCFANKPRTSIGKRKEPLQIPETLDYELWCGPARKEPIYRDRIQYDCSFTWNMGDGESCNQGVHEIDIARRLLGEQGLPRRVMSIGGRFVFHDAGDVPNTQIIYYDFAAAPVLYEVHNLRAVKGSQEVPTYRGQITDVCVHCEGGYVMMHRGIVYDQEGKTLRQFSRTRDHTAAHFDNFIQAVRSGKQTDLNCDILEGHISTNICHAGNISYRLGRPAGLEKVREQIGDLPPFQEMFDRYLQHLAAHEIDPGESILGPWLECDSARECIKDNAEADALVKGFYREPFVVPEVKV